MYDVLVIGAGPAGLTAGIYAQRASLKTLILESGVYGGQIINTLDIENYPAAFHISGFDFATNLYNQAKDLGCEINFEKVISFSDNHEYKEVVTDKNTYKAKTVIVATGSINKTLNLEGENRFVGKGISYCATCDGAFYKGKDVLVVGGGNTAIEDALYLSKIAKKVYLVHRRDEFRAENETVKQLKEKENVKFILNSNVIKINGEEKLESVIVKNKDSEEKEIKIDGLFIAIGRSPETDIFKGILNLNEEGYIIASEDCKTNIEGVFACGDNREKSVRQLVTATSDGANSVRSAIEYINGRM